MHQHNRSEFNTVTSDICILRFRDNENMLESSHNIPFDIRLVNYCYKSHNNDNDHTLLLDTSHGIQFQTSSLLEVK